MKTIVQSPSPDLARSLDFYTKLGFRTQTMEGANYVTNESVCILINNDRFARAGLCLYLSDLKDTVDQLNKICPVHSFDGHHVLASPSGTCVYLFDASKEPSIELTTQGPKTLGNFAGLSLETFDMNKSAQIWQLLGFKLDGGGLDQGWVSYKNEDGFVISLMGPNSCPHLFFNPSLTYFNGGNNLAVIDKLRDLEIPITEEITAFNKEGKVDNVIIRDPGGYGFFIFND